MPNWCFNHLYITGDKETLDKFAADVDAHTAEGADPCILETFFPFPVELEASGASWYDWCINNWGTKWGDCHTRKNTISDGLLYIFDTAWSPPTKGIVKLSEMFPDLKFVLVYEEGGMQFMGGECISGGKMLMQVSVEYPDVPDDDGTLDYDPYDVHNETVALKFNKLVDGLRTTTVM